MVCRHRYQAGDGRSADDEEAFRHGESDVRTEYGSDRYSYSKPITHDDSEHRSHNDSEHSASNDAECPND